MGLLDYQNFLMNESVLYESAMSPTQWKKDGGKYRTMFQEFLKDSTKELKVDPEFQKSFRVSSFKVSDISNLEEIIAYIGGGGEISTKGPFLKVGKEEIPLTKLQKTGVFTSTSKAGDTDTKELMVVYFYYNQDVDLSSIDEEDAAALVNNIPADDLSQVYIDKIRAWLLGFDSSDKELVSLAKQWKSCANALSAFKNAGYRMDRKTVLGAARDAARKLTGLSPDNWCPGDVYLVDASAKANALQHISNAQTVAELNLLFNDTLTPRSSNSEAYGSIVAISLKQQVARLGRAKEFLKSISPGDAKYNLTKDELAKENDSDWLKSEIMSYQQKMKDAASSSGITVNYSPSDANAIKPKNLIDKLAAIKLAYHLLTLPKNSPEDLDSNLLRILMFGLKAGNAAVNPPYFKVTGSSKGSADVEEVKVGNQFSLLVGGFDSKETNLAILDAATRLDIVLFYYVCIGDSAYEIRLRAATTSSKQAGLEFEGKNYIGNMVQDPSGTKAKIESLFQQRSSGK
jgi:hypothetical protein